MIPDNGHSGDAALFQGLCERYLPRVSRLAFRLCGCAEDMEDVVQEVFLAAWRRAGKLKLEGDAWPWLAAVTVNQCRTLQRRRWLSLKYLAKALRQREKAVPPPVERPGIEEAASRIHRAVQALPLKLREVAVLRYLEEIEIEQIADILALSRNAVEVRLHRARSALQESLRAFLAE